MNMDEEKIETHVLRKYELISKIGKGAYGVVWKARSKKTKKIVALKKIFNCFQNAIDAQRTYREISYLQQFDHENIIKLLNVIKSENNKDMYLIFEYVEADLSAVIKAKTILHEVHK